MATEHFCLRWNNHQSTLVSVFDNLLESGTLVDCTLAADGRYLKAHKVVLSACSPYLGMLLSQHHDKHPIIILKDVKFEELKAMLDYMYRGEVNISQEQLTTFLKAAESLQIKGLTDTGGEEGLQPIRPPSSNSTVSANNDEASSPGSPSRKRKRNRTVDEMPDCETKLTISDGSVNASVTKTSVGVKREPADTDGDGQSVNADESGDSAMLARPGPSNGGSTNNKGLPWPFSGDNSEEMQLTPGQGGDFEKLKETIKEEPASSEIKIETEVKEEIFVDTKVKEEIVDDNDAYGSEETSVDPLADSSQTDSANEDLEERIPQQPIIVNNHYFYQNELIVPEVLEEENSKKFVPEDKRPRMSQSSRSSIGQNTTPRVAKAFSNSVSNPSSVNKTTSSSTPSETFSAKKSYDVSQMFKCNKKVYRWFPLKKPSDSEKKTPLNKLKKKPLGLPKYRNILPAKPIDMKKSSDDTNPVESQARVDPVNSTILSVPCKPPSLTNTCQSSFVPVSVGLNLQSSSVSNITLPTQSHFAISTSQQITTSQGSQIMNQFQMSSPNLIQSSQDPSLGTQIINQFQIPSSKVIQSPQTAPLGNPMANQFQISSPNIIQSPQDPNTFFQNINQGVFGTMGGVFLGPNSSQYACSQLALLSSPSSSQRNPLVLDSQKPTTQVSVQEVLKFPNIPTSSQFTSISPQALQSASKSAVGPAVKRGRGYRPKVVCTPTGPVKILPKPDT